MQLLLSGLVGLGAGVLSGLLGIGGGVVLVPLLALLLGMGQLQAQGLTLAVLLLPIGLPAVVAYHRRFPIRWALVGLLVAGFLPGVLAGSSLAVHLPERPLRALFVLLLLAVAWRGLRGRPADEGSAEPERSLLHGLWIGAVAGVTGGLLGIGGGIVIVPLLTGVLRVSQHRAQGASLAVLLPPIGLPGVWVYARAQGGLPWALVGAVALSFAAGAFLGAGLAARIDTARLQRVFAVFVLATAASMAWRVVAG
ncbi:MAG: sulfite exporter TauE/SafE family protein [Deltaproteobacteria bacterium]|nr:sulfite exporter TauE/SafE family protein [Deltaproteobacteria bacterium]